MIGQHLIVPNTRLADLPELAALHALVTTTALMMEGTALMPTLAAAIANGEAPASPVRAVSPLSAEDTIKPMKKIVLI